MKVIFGSASLCIAIVMAAGLANAQEKTIKRVPPKPTVSVDGKTLFREYCAVCHGSDGKGAGPAASALKQPPGDLTRIASNNGGKFPDERILRIIRGAEPVSAHGTEDMPMWGRIFNNMGSLSLAQTRVHALVQYVEGLQAK